MSDAVVNQKDDEAPPSDSPVRRWGRALGRRLVRLRPDLVPAGYLAWAIACWVLTVLVAVTLVVPALTDGVDAEPVGAARAIGIFAAPLAFRLLVAAAGAMLTGTLVAILLVRARIGHAHPTREGVVREVLVAVAVGFPALALLADRAWLAGAIVLLFAAAAEVAFHLGPLRAAGGGVLAAAVATTPWLGLVAFQLTPAGGAPGSWTWLALFGFAAAFAAFGSYYGVARAAESRTRALRFLFRDDLHPLLVFGIVVFVAVAVGARLTVGRDLFPEPDPTLWNPWGRSGLSWLHAVLVGGLIAIVAVRSTRRPLLRFGERRITAALAGAGNTDLVLSAGVILLGMFVAAAFGIHYLPDGWVVAVPLLKFLGVVAIGTVAVLPVFRGTASRWLAIVSAAYLIPVTLAGMLRGFEVVLPPGLEEFAASPVQVAMVLVAVAFVLAIVNPLRAEARRWSPSVLVRLSVVPLVAVHAGWLLPAAWSDLGRIVLIAGVVLALLFFMPPVAADPRRHVSDVLSASAAQLLALVVVALALPSLFDDPAVVVLGLFWLTVAVVAALCFETTERSEPVEAAAGP